MTAQWRRELTIAAVAFAVGFFVLPLAIYWLGQRVLGNYAPGAGVLDLADQIWGDLLALAPAAWLLVLSPYLLLQLFRLLRRLLTARNPVKPVTNPASGR
ncbi:MAG TPA: hypothetical protein VFX89_11345 [Gammaproteobacteria bacterium]|nr:hypothetical protein [Gammaproteobacteria bacterium]